MGSLLISDTPPPSQQHHLRCTCSLLCLQVVSGLVKYIPEHEMQQRLCVLVCNLKPANMRGVKSHAMVLAATSPDGLKVSYADAPLHEIHTAHISLHPQSGGC